MTSQGTGFRETLKNPVNLFKNNLNNTRNEVSNSKKKERWNSGITKYQHFSKKRSLMRGQKLFSANKLWGGCSKLED